MAKMVYILAKDGMPLMPTSRFGHVRRMLDAGLFVPVTTRPFTVRMTYEPENTTVQPVGGGMDPGRTNIGLSAESGGHCLERVHCTTRNKEIPKLMEKRKEHRRASRSGARKRRKRRAWGNNTVFMHFKEDPTIWKHCEDFKNGPLKGHGSVNDAVDAMQEGKCLLCGGRIEHHHHVIPRSEGGSDTMDNIAGICLACHDKVHKDAKAKEKLKAKTAGRNKKYGALSILNQVMPYFLKYLETIFPDNVHVTRGWETSKFREDYGIGKDHGLDAYCIAMAAYDGSLPYVEQDFPDTQEALQFRRHDRALVKAQRERTYKYEGKTVAKNRHKRMSQTDSGRWKTQPYDSLEEWYAKQVELYGEKEAMARLSRLEVQKSRRYYNDMCRVLPGAQFICQGKRYILTGQLSNGQYYRAYGRGRGISRLQNVKYWH